MWSSKPKIVLKTRQILLTNTDEKLNKTYKTELNSTLKYNASWTSEIYFTNVKVCYLRKPIK